MDWLKKLWGRWLCFTGRHDKRACTFNDFFTDYQNKPGWICERCMASWHKED